MGTSRSSEASRHAVTSVSYLSLNTTMCARYPNPLQNPSSLIPWTREMDDMEEGKLGSGSQSWLEFRSSLNIEQPRRNVPLLPMPQILQTQRADSRKAEKK